MKCHSLTHSVVLTKKILECRLMFPVDSLALPKEEERKEAIEALVDFFFLKCTT